MSLSIGIVGLPNVGKSTLFNALVRAHQAAVADYPFTTIEPNVGIVEVPDERLQLIASSLQLKKVIPATIKFIDIAGLVKNAHQGEGLGNQFLGHIREVDAIIHILDGFSDKANAEEDKEIVKTELELAEIKKPTIYVLNIGENKLKEQNSSFKDTIYISAKFESELIDLPEKEQKEFLTSYNLKESCLNRLIKESYRLLNLITFYTLISQKQIQAWSILRGTDAPQAAGKVHTDFESGFIAAEVCHYDDLIKSGGWHEAKRKGLIRTEGKNYIVQDGDVVLFKFNI